MTAFILLSLFLLAGLGLLTILHNGEARRFQTQPSRVQDRPRKRAAAGHIVPVRRAKGPRTWAVEPFPQRAATYAARSRSR